MNRSELLKHRQPHDRAAFECEACVEFIYRQDITCKAWLFFGLRVLARLSDEDKPLRMLGVMGMMIRPTANMSRYVTVANHTNSASPGVCKTDNSQVPSTVVKKIAWFSFLYVASLTSFCAMGGSMRILLSSF